MTEIFQPELAQDPRTRQAPGWLIAILFAIVFEGGMRKWLLPPGLHPLAYVSKDILALAFIVRFGLPVQFRVLRRLRDCVLIIACLLLPCFLLGLTWSAVAAAMNFKNAVLWPLFAIYMGAWLDWKTLRKLTLVWCLLSIGMAALGFVQFHAPVSAALNRYAWHVIGKMERIATFGASDVVRATGTFSYISGYATFASVGFLWMVWRLLNYRGRLDRLFCTVGAVACLVCILTSGSRAPLYQCMLGLLVAIIVSSKMQLKLRIVVLCAAAAIAYVTLSGQELVTSFYGRVSAAGDSVAERVTGDGLKFVALMLERPFGVGMGQESNVQDYRIVERTSAIEFMEDGRSRMAVEGGVLAVLAQAVTLALFFQIVHMSWRTRNDQSMIAAAAMLPAVLYLLTNCLWYDHNASALWWFFIGAWLAVTLRVTPSPASVLWTYSCGMDHRQSPVWQSELV